MNNIIDEFNNTLDEFLQKIINQFPEQSKLKKYHKTFKLTSLYDKSLPIKIYIGSTINYKEQISKRDSEFFKYKPGFSEYCTKYSSFANDSGLVERWDGLSDESKNSIWDYVQTLFVMGEMYINKDSNLINEINKIKQNFTESEVNNIYNNNNISEQFKTKIK